MRRVYREVVFLELTAQFPGIAKDPQLDELWLYVGSFTEYKRIQDTQTTNIKDKMTLFEILTGVEE